MNENEKMDRYKICVRIYMRERESKRKKHQIKSNTRKYTLKGISFVIIAIVWKIVEWLYNLQFSMIWDPWLSLKDRIRLIHCTIFPKQSH